MRLPGLPVLGALAAAMLGLAVALLWPREEVTVEAAVRSRIEALTAAAESRELGALTDGLSETFRSKRGLTKDSARGFLAGLILKGEWVRVFATDLDVKETSETSATCQGTFVFVRAGNAMSRYDLSGTFVKEEDTWRMTEASEDRR